MTSDKVAILAELAVAAAAFQAARRSLEAAVDRARSAGASWSEVGQAVGMSRQGAFQRFGSLRSRHDGSDQGQGGGVRPPSAASTRDEAGPGVPRRRRGQP